MIQEQGEVVKWEQELQVTNIFSSILTFISLIVFVVVPGVCFHSRKLALDFESFGLMLMGCFLCRVF